jgi:hypothetical protein
MHKRGLAVPGKKPRSARKATPLASNSCVRFEGRASDRTATSNVCEEDLSDGPKCASHYGFFARGVGLEAKREQNSNGTVAELEAARRAGILADISKRIRRACTHLSEEEFTRLVDEMTDRQLKGERRINREFLLE